MTLINQRFGSAQQFLANDNRANNGQSLQSATSEWRNDLQDRENILDFKLSRKNTRADVSHIIIVYKNKQEAHVPLEQFLARMKNYKERKGYQSSVMTKDHAIKLYKVLNKQKIIDTDFNIIKTDDPLETIVGSSDETNAARTIAEKEIKFYEKKDITKLKQKFQEAMVAENFANQRGQALKNIFDHIQLSLCNPNLSFNQAMNDIYTADNGELNKPGSQKALSELRDQFADAISQGSVNSLNAFAQTNLGKAVIQNSEKLVFKAFAHTFSSFCIANLPEEEKSNEQKTIDQELEMFISMTRRLKIINEKKQGK